ncbi:GGDEF domain-containing protein [Bradyrhizobium canariense]|jgi:diguanylate cyclase (GGDEF)-like protein|uniref:diguanylate cyclase n=2 Tax=Bradyrhizobium canariense TaxID=255045 RepID=A0A1X3EFD8_9BRAD|nr:GGDEF domain-containing protein [Bradyrhizobium canariense]OSI33619.1 GGDEF domain-containing protein [Bradyrhizobium canariense]OSI44283.1 GGDEF domain-containing protein [Bradyrhizobium canariense]OSI52557.1 GGDEF domain-containing protein [Bradyrhizobium canariense]OSI55091.1 GGDEF domain-containing protein [Bradyrhizobium canariense]
MNYPVLVNPRKPSLSRMPMKKPKRASAAKAKKGPKASAGRSKVALKRPAKRRIKGPARRPTRPSQRAASADDGAKAAIEPAINATIRELRSKLRGALRRVAELEAAADTDFLLEIPNRRGFERELARAVAYMKRYRASGALIVLDVDRLKPINDSFGHAAGDEVLKAIATTLTRQIRASDVVGRLGGDEFALLLWNLSETDAKAKAAAFEQAIDELSFVFRGQHVSAGASAGVALLGVQSDATRALEEADAAMYVRKAHRRHEPHIRLVSS